MIEILTRDGAARRARWTLAGRALTTPLVLYADTERAPAPLSAEVLLASRAPRDGDRPWILDRGSAFAALPPAPAAALSIAPDLPYTPAGGAPLLAAAHAENLERRGAGEFFVAASPRDAPPVDAEVVAMGSARSLLTNPYAFAKHVTALRETIGPARLLYAPGCGLPEELALLAYVGVDLVDSVEAILAARRGEHLTPEGPVAEAFAPEKGRDALLAHNLAAVEAERRRVHVAIESGKLRELVETRVRARPDLAANLRRLDLEAYEFFEPRVPLLRPGPLYATSKESLQRPEIRRWHRRLETRYAKPRGASVLLLLPCSARKPYSESKTHRILADAVEMVPNRAAVHEVILTSPLGVVPRELERCYPAAHYDLPVTGHWDEDEKRMIREAVAALASRSKYDAFVIHLEDAEREIVADLLPGHRSTAIGDPLSPASLASLRTTLSEVASGAPRVRWPDRNLDDLESLARWQFGEAGAAALVAGATARGRFPHLKLLDGNTGAQLAMIPEDRGLLSLTLEAGARLLDAGVHRVEIDNFRPKGTIFAVGVKGADADVHPEDEVVIHHAGELRAVGRALMPGVEMAAQPKGPAVAVRHYAKAPGKEVPA